MREWPGFNRCDRWSLLRRHRLECLVPRLETLQRSSQRLFKMLKRCACVVSRDEALATMAWQLVTTFRQRAC